LEKNDGPTTHQANNYTAETDRVSILAKDKTNDWGQGETPKKSHFNSRFNQQVQTVSGLILQIMF
jgi:hypothetical protein